jgi:hypothetical protein
MTRRTAILLALTGNFAMWGLIVWGILRAL